MALHQKRDNGDTVARSSRSKRNTSSSASSSRSNGDTVARPVFKSSIWKNGPSPGRFELSKDVLKWKCYNGPGIWDPQFEVVQIEIHALRGDGL